MHIAVVTGGMGGLGKSISTKCMQPDTGAVTHSPATKR